MDEWSDRHFAPDGEAWKYLNDRYERSMGRLDADRAETLLNEVDKRIN